MQLRNFLGGVVATGVMAIASGANAQEAPRTTSSGDGHASGFMLQGRLLAQGGLPYVGGGPAPGFLVGYQGPSFALGLGLGITRVGVSAGSEGSGSLTLFQVMPTALIDVWHSRDRRASANVIGGVGYGRASLEATGTSQNCNASANGTTCTTETQTSKAGAGYVPFMLGFGGDYYLSRNFALGAEVGLQAAVTAGVDVTSNSQSRDVDASANLQLAYGALRATLVIGD